MNGNSDNSPKMPNKPKDEKFFDYDQEKGGVSRDDRNKSVNTAGTAYLRNNQYGTATDSNPTNAQ